MKTSKIILTSYLSIIGLFLLSFLIQVKDMKRPDKDFEKMLHKENIELPYISTIIAEDGFFELNTGSKDSLKLGLNKTKMPVKPVYRISNDSLFIVGNSNAFYTKVTCKNVKEIILNHSSFQLNDFLTSRLKVIAKAGDIELNNLKSFSYLELNLSDKSYINAAGYKIDSLFFTLSKSMCNFNNVNMINFTKGEMRDSSEYYFNNCNELHIKKDSTSQIEN